MKQLILAGTLLSFLGILSTSESVLAANKSNCQLIESSSSIAKRLKGLSGKVKVQNLSRQCESDSTPSLKTIRVINAKNSEVLGQITANSTDLKINLPADKFASIALEAKVHGKSPFGVKIRFGNKSQRELTAPYAIPENDNGNFKGMKIEPRMYSFSVFLCASKRKSCSQRIFAGTVHFLRDNNSSPSSPTATPTPVFTSHPSNPTPIHTPTIRPTATPTPTTTSTPSNGPSVASSLIQSINYEESGTIVGEAPFSVFVKGIKTFSDISTNASCLSIYIPDQNGITYIPKGHAQRTVWEQNGDKRARCLEDVDNQVMNASRDALKGKATLMTAEYRWNFGDGTSSSLYNDLEGWNAAHTYNAAGNYLITLEVRAPDGTIFKSTKKVVVKNSSRKSYYISQYGSDSNDGLSSNTPLKSIAKVKSIAAAQGNFQLLFKRGETFTFGPTSGSITLNKSNIRIGSYGSGDLPRFWWDGGKSNSNHFIIVSNTASEVTIEDIRFDTNIVGIFGSANYNEKDGVPTAIKSSGQRVLIRNTDVGRVNNFIALGPNAGIRPSGTLIVKNTANLDNGIRGYFMFNGTGYMTVALGNTFRNSTREHGIRSAGSYEFINAQYNSFRNTKIDDIDSRKGTLVSQGGGLIHYAHNEILEAPAGLEVLGGDRGMRGERTRFAKVVKNKFDARDLYFPRTKGGGAGLYIGDGATHVLVANNMFELGNGVAVTGYDQAINILGADGDYNRFANNILIAHNSVSTTATAIYRKFLVMYSGSKNVRVVNNAMFYPSFDGGSFSTTPANLNLANDGVGAGISEIAQMSCNTFPVPTSYRGQPFNINTHGINAIKGSFLTAIEWGNRFKNLRGTNGSADKFHKINIQRVDGAAIPELNAKSALECNKVAEIHTDFFGRARKSKVTAGAYEYD